MYFGSQGRRLFGCLHGPESANCGVVLCPPFGHEAIRAHRLLKSLAERLGRKGYAVLRFDPFGSGDSEGDDDDLDLIGWSADVLAAHSELVRRASPARVAWVSLRLGAAACAMAAAEATRLGLPVSMLMCSPIVNGRDYAEALRRRHVVMLDTSLGVAPWPRAREVATIAPEAFREEALGHGLSVHMREQLSQHQLWPCVPESMKTVCLLDDAEPGCPAHVRALPVAEQVDWLSDLPPDGALVPGKLLNQLQEELGVLCA